MEANASKFVAHVKRMCETHNVTLITQNEPFYEDEELCGGYFSFDKKELAVSCIQDDYWFINLMVHEYSHMEQWLDDDPCIHTMMRGGIDAGTLIGKWIKGVNYKNESIKKAIKLIIALEHNCEKRAVQNIIKYKLPINIDEYCRQANTYLYFHYYMKKKRQWEFNKSPLDLVNVIKYMPSELDQNYNRLPKVYYDLFDAYIN